MPVTDLACRKLCYYCFRCMSWYSRSLNKWMPCLCCSVRPCDKTNGSIHEGLHSWEATFMRGYIHEGLWGSTNWFHVMAVYFTWGICIVGFKVFFIDKRQDLGLWDTSYFSLKQKDKVRLERQQSWEREGGKAWSLMWTWTLKRMSLAIRKPSCPEAGGLFLSQPLREITGNI